MRRYYPSVDELLSLAAQADNPEAPVLEVHRSLLSIMSNTILFLFTLVVVVVVNATLPDINLLGFLHSSMHVSGRWLAIVPAGILIEIIRKYHDDLYILTTTHITVQSGRLSLTYSVPNIRYVDIRIIEVQQDLMGRIFNYGDIELNTAAQDSFEVYIEGVRSPRELGLLVESLRQRHLQAASEDNEDGSIPPDLVSE